MNEDFPELQEPLDDIISTRDDFVFLRDYPNDMKARECCLRLRAKKVPVLIIGETGTGKELVAKAIHGNSSAPLVTVNAGGIPETLLESELFGHERGAFTGADKRRIGLLEHASEGTLFLDEIGELPLAMQAKLLRALQEKEIRRLGGNETIKTDFRLVTATNKPFLNNDPLFRKDLYYRIATVVLETLPLQKPAIEDVNLIAQKIASAHKTTVPIEAVHKIIETHHPFIGNIRQLENAVLEWIALFS